MAQIARSLSDGLRRAYRPLLVVLGIGAALRLLAMVGYSSVVLRYYGNDSIRYAGFPYGVNEKLFTDFWQPQGYPMFVRGVRTISNQIAVTIGLQHLIGLAAAVVLYAAVRRFGGPRWLGVVPAAVVALSGDQIFLEHALLTEGVFILPIAAGLYAMARSLDDPRREAWLAAGGALLAAAALVRSPALGLPVVAAVWIAFAAGGPVRRRLRHAGAVLVPAIAVVGVYLIVASASGPYAGLTDMAGFNLYARTAQFADCSRFDPPDGTDFLCEKRPEPVLHGPLWYSHFPEAPYWRHGPPDPEGGREAGRWARAAILHQPIDYVRAVGRDLVRYAAPDAGRERQFDGSDPRDISFGAHHAAGQSLTEAQMARVYSQRYDGIGDPSPRGDGEAVLEAWQDALRVQGLILVLLAAVTVAGLVLGRGRLRTGAALFAACAAWLYVLPVMALTYDIRYGVPAAQLLAAAAALAAGSLLSRAPRMLLRRLG